MATLPSLRERAEKVAPERDLGGAGICRPTPIRRSIGAWLEKHPKSFWGLRRLGRQARGRGEVGRAKEALEKLKALYPEYVGPENAYVLLAAVYRRLSDRPPNARSSRSWRCGMATRAPAYLRLMELDEAAGDWRGAGDNARRLLAVNPLIPAPHRGLARAAEQLGERDEAVAAYRALSLLDDTDPAEVHYRLAKLLRQAGKPDEARREVLKSLEEAPRFLDAHRLLLELVESGRLSLKASPASTPTRGDRSHDPKTPVSVSHSRRCWSSPSARCLAQPGGPFRRAVAPR